MLLRKVEEGDFIQKCHDLKKYIENLGHEVAIVIDPSQGAFCYADQVESRVDLCYVIDQYKFQIIENSQNRTDK